MDKVDKNEKIRKFMNDISDMKKLSENDLKIINNLNYEDRMLILVSYNNMIEYFEKYLVYPK